MLQKPDALYNLVETSLRQGLKVWCMTEYTIFTRSHVEEVIKDYGQLTGPQLSTILAILTVLSNYGHGAGMPMPAQLNIVITRLESLLFDNFSDQDANNIQQHYLDNR